MVHFRTVLRGAKLLRGDGKSVDDVLLEGIEERTEKDMSKQHAKIKSKLRKGEELNEFEKWFRTTAEYQRLGEIR